VGLDIRLPIGGLFTVIGILLTGYGVLADQAIYQASLGVNVNLRWGLVMLVFGLIMAAFGQRAGRRSKHQLS
jgi:hypothetical protein